MDIQPYTITESYAVGRPWLMSMLGIEANQTITLDLSAFDENLHWTEASKYQPERKLKSGIPLGKNTTTGLFEPYAAVTNEVQTLTVTGGPTGGTFTITWSGQTTAAIAYNATAAVVQTALEALSNVAPATSSSPAPQAAPGPSPGVAPSSARTSPHRRPPRRSPAAPLPTSPSPPPPPEEPQPPQTARTSSPGSSSPRCRSTPPPRRSRHR
ncbi:hypothetical protein [Streptomyces microflavus]|uniref:hypothetical protein n=1 Tax=Streptomyces microflavus TaxID=1919 RepID=UPI003B20EE91